MTQNHKVRSLRELATPPNNDAAAVLARARALHAAARAGMPALPLRGKNLGLLCDSADAHDGALFQRAASALGAQVAHVRPSLTEHSSAQEIQHTARLLGRLYDAIDCVGMAPGLVGKIGAGAGVPVFEGIASPRHPTAGLADLLDAPLADDDRRCLVIQAVLLGALG